MKTSYDFVLLLIMISDSGKLKKKIRQNTIYLNDDEDLTTDLVYNGGFFRCDINMKDIDTKFSK